MCEQCAWMTRRGLLGGLSATLVASAGPAPQATINGETALHRLMEGNARYVANKTHVHDFDSGRAARVTAHRPLATILSCSDARVGPEFLFDQGPGNLFVVRVAGNIAEEDGLASMEYAAQFLGSPLILVLGHSQCGAVEAAIKVVQDNAVLPGHLPHLIDHIKPAVLAAEKSQPSNLWDAVIVENVRGAMRELSESDALLAGMVSSGKVRIAGGVYDIATGAVKLI